MALAPVDFDPFAGVSASDGAGTLTPIDHDPFTPVSRETGGFSKGISDALRPAGLAARAVVQGTPSAVFGLPALGMDAMDSINNAGRMVYNAIAPSLGADKTDYIEPWRHVKGIEQAGVTAANDIGLPQPADKMETGLVGAGTAAASAFGGAGLSGAVAKTLEGASGPVSSIMGELSAAPHLQAAGGAGAVLAPQIAEDAGVKNPLVLGGLGMIGAIAPGSVGTAGERLAGGVGGLAAPFRSVGKETANLPGVSREAIVGRVLNKMSTTPGLTPSIMDASGPIVPDSNPTMAQVSRDPGLIAGEVGIRNAIDSGPGGGRIAQRLSEQNSARQAALDDIILPSQPVPEGAQPQPGTLEYAQAKRDQTVDIKMQPAFAQAQANRNVGQQLGITTPGAGLGFADTKPVLDTIDSILATPNGARKPVQQAMGLAKDALTQPGVDTTDPETLYAIRKDLADAKNGKYNTTQPGLALAGSQLKSVIGSLDDAIDQAAPGYSKYMDLYAKRSVPLNQQGALSDLRNRGAVSVSDPVTGQPILTMGKFGVAVKKAIASGALGKGVGNANLSDPQIQKLVDITSDLDRGAATTASTIKPPGSDTMRNLTTANLIGRVMGDNFPATGAGQAMKTFSKGISWLYSAPDEAMQQMLVDAVLDPKLASRFMKTANRSDLDAIGTALAKRAGRGIQGAGLTNENAATPP